MELTYSGGDISFDIQVIHGYRRFCNKIYQATKYVQKALGEDFEPQSSGSKTGSESLAERWILHKFNEASKAINASLEAREFSDAASTIYQYWLYQLCDVFIENSKSLLQPDSREMQQRSAKETLYTVLEGGLKLMHPIMPFVTEELWQRLPRRPGDKAISIMNAPYPIYNASYDNPAAETAYELILATSKGIRSLLSQYEFKEPGDIFIQTYDRTSHKTATEEITSIKSLGGKYVGNIEILSLDNKTPPRGCVVFAVGAQAAVYLHVAGKVDVEEEEEKARTKLEKAKETVKKQQGIMAAAGWREKVKQEVQEAEEKKLKDSQSEVTRFQEAVRDLERLRLED